MFLQIQYVYLCKFNQQVGENPTPLFADLNKVNPSSAVVTLTPICSPPSHILLSQRVTTRGQTDYDCECQTRQFTALQTTLRAVLLKRT